jgi:hypothetical protein
VDPKLYVTDQGSDFFLRGSDPPPQHLLSWSIFEQVYALNFRFCFVLLRLLEKILVLFYKIFIKPQ